MYLSYAVLKELMKNSRELPIYAFRARDCIQHFTSFIFIHFSVCAVFLTTECLYSYKNVL